MRKTEQNKLNKTNAHHTYNARKAGENGITLVSLVITIIVLLVLAGVAINMAINSDGLFAKANEVTEEWNTSVGQEETTINNLIDTLEEMTLTAEPMITKWNIAAGDTVKIYLYRSEDYNGNTLPDNTDVTIDWGDGTEEHYTSSNLQYEKWGSGYITHTYTTTNNSNIVTINGKCNTIRMDNVLQLTSIEQWGYTETYVYSFGSCENLVTIVAPEKYTFKNVTSFQSTFVYCSSLIAIPNGMFVNCSNVMSFEGTFYGCVSLTTIPDGLFANCSNVTSFEETFLNCRSLTAIPNGLFVNCSNATSFQGTFGGCSAFTAIPEDLFADCTNVISFAETFSWCGELTNIPEELFVNCSNVTSFRETFEGCASLTGNPIPLWERVEDGVNNGYNGVPDGYGCYYGCEGLTGYNDGTIPSYWRDSLPSI